MHEKPKNRSQTIRHRRLSGPERLCRMHEKPENQTRQTNTRRVIPENEFNNHTTSAEKPFNSNKYEAPSSNLRKTEHRKNQTHAQKAQEHAHTERRILARQPKEHRNDIEHMRCPDQITMHDPDPTSGHHDPTSKRTSKRLGANAYQTKKGQIRTFKSQRFRIPNPTSGHPNPTTERTPKRLRAHAVSRGRIRMHRSRSQFDLWTPRPNIQSNIETTRSKLRPDEEEIELGRSNHNDSEFLIRPLDTYNSSL